ncbi:MAG TPA: nucleoside hydrolase [Thermoanaerobaculia bacterium]|jgi:purine nucleosidase|nr:nucleoside hydrolase [Thermoanaerobaculia bacterium]
MDVILVHDAAIDEYMSQVLLTTMPGIDLLGVVIVNADCIDSAAMQTDWQVMSYIGRTDIPIGLSSARGWNPFPWSYRSDCVRESAITCLKNFPPNPKWPPFPDGDTLLRSLMEKAKGPVTLLVTCPFTPIMNLLQQSPKLASKIEQIIWMGGAINVPGNLDPTTVPTPPWNACAEWNAFWDATSVDWVFKNTTCPIIQFPLDMTNQATISTSFMETLAVQARKGSRYSELAFESYMLVSYETFYDMWDVVTTCWLANQGFFATPTTMNLVIDTTLNNKQGCIKQSPGGRAVQVVLNFSPTGQQAFYDYVTTQFNR